MILNSSITFSTLISNNQLKMNEITVSSIDDKMCCYQIMQSKVRFWFSRTTAALSKAVINDTKTGKRGSKAESMRFMDHRRRLRMQIELSAT